MKLVLVLVVLIGLGTVVATIVVGTDLRDTVVSDAPYEEGLAWDAQREARETAGVEVELLDAGFSIGQHPVRFALVDVAGRRVTDGQVTVRLTRAHTGASDRVVPVDAGADGVYHGTLSLPDPGAWELIVQVRRNGADAELRRRIVVSP